MPVKANAKNLCEFSHSPRFPFSLYLSASHPLPLNTHKYDKQLNP